MAACSPSPQARPRTITSHSPGSIDRKNETIVGLQTDAPLKRATMPLGGRQPLRHRISARAGHARCWWSARFLWRWPPQFGARSLALAARGYANPSVLH